MLFSFLFKWDKNSFLRFNLLMEDWAEIKGIIISHCSIHKDSRISFLSDCKSKTFPLSLNFEYLGIQMFSSPRQLLLVHCPHVNSEIASLNTLVWTIRTLERFLSRVSQLMIFQLKLKLDNKHVDIVWKLKFLAAKRSSTSALVPPSVCLSVCLWSKLNFSLFGQLMTTYDNVWRLIYDSLWQLMTTYDSFW